MLLKLLRGELLVGEMRRCIARLASSGIVHGRRAIGGLVGHGTDRLVRLAKGRMAGSCFGRVVRDDLHRRHRLIGCIIIIPPSARPSLRPWSKYEVYLHLTTSPYSRGGWLGATAMFGVWYMTFCWSPTWDEQVDTIWWRSRWPFTASGASVFQHAES